VVGRWGEGRRARLADRRVIPSDTEIARMWGELAGAAQLRGAGPAAEQYPDRRLRYQVPIVTLNAADLGDLAEHHGLV